MHWKNEYIIQFLSQWFTPPFVSSYGGHGRAQIQQAEGLCQEGFCRAHGESLQHQSAYTEVVNWLISTHYIDPLGTWVPFKTLKARGGLEKRHSKT